MRCGKAREWLSLEIDGQLPPDRIFSLEEHLEKCAECRTYRADLRLGQRLLRATEPTPSESFEWQLQLRLNRTLQTAAGETGLPWTETGGGLRLWFRNFSLATAAGLAAMVAVALFVLPPVSNQVALVDRTGPASEAIGAETSVATDRLPLSGTWSRSGSGLGRPVSAGGSSSPFGGSRLRTPPALSGEAWQGLRTLAALREENRRLHTALTLAQWELAALKAQLDTSGTHNLTLQGGEE